MSKRFDNWEQVDCNECGNYWTDKCDGVKSGDKKVCNSFIAQRNVVIPKQLKVCEDSIKLLSVCVVVEGVFIATLAVLLLVL